MKKKNNFTKNEEKSLFKLKNGFQYVLRKIELTSSCVIVGFFELAATKKK
jgi:hypothetical protein